MSGFKAKFALAAVLVAVPGIALAHTGVGHDHGFGHGFAHPFGGLDHVLAMVAVGLLAAHLGGRALWLVPVSFLTLMAIGGVLASTGFQFLHTEALIALSVIVLGMAVAQRVDIPTLAAMALVGFFALFHGYAHVAELANAGSIFVYALGFMAATALLHGLGIGLGSLIARIGETRAPVLARAAGAAISLAGVAIFVAMA